MDLLALAVQVASAALLEAQPPEADSVRLLRDARRAQQRFESVRRSNLPASRSGGSPECEARIGRFCYWQDQDDTPYDERERVTRERDRLLDQLALAARAAPGDEWIVGQRVRYLLDGRRAAEARTAAAECRAEAWWCDALLGLALQADGEYGAANATFDAALAAMPEDLGCRWRDISPLLEEELRRAQARTECASRAPLEERFWKLSQPLYLLGGNDLRSEHFARRVMSRLEAQARGAYEVGWGDDVDELLVRYGWPTSWSRVRDTRLNGPNFVQIVGHEPVPSWHFPVDGRLLTAPLPDARPGDWPLRRPLAVARYAPSYARSFRELEHQLARFERGDSMIVVVAVDETSDPVLSQGAAEVAVTGMSLDPLLELSERSRLHQGRAVMTMAAPPTGLLVSVELLDRKAGIAARSRYGIAPRGRLGRLALSDLLLHEPLEEQPRTLEEVVERAAGTTVLDADRHSKVGVYWEGYGLDPSGETAEVVLALQRTDIAWLTRAAARLRLRGPAARPLNVRWREVYGGAAEGPGRSLTIDVSGIRPGRYLLSVTVTAPDGATAAAEQLIEIAASRP
jgi:hypothetical protein